MTFTREFATSIETQREFRDCVAVLRQALKKAGFSVLTELPVHREVEKQVGLSTRKYLVFVVWSPFLAYQAMLSELEAGMFMPFNLVVADNGHSTSVAAVNHLLFGRMMGTLGAQVLAREISGRIRRVFSSLAAQEETPAAVGQ